MSPEPLVSIVTMCYRHEPYLDDYFQSLLRQTYRNIEVIFLDDGSPDGSWGKARGYESDLRSRCRRVVMQTQPNAGMHTTLLRVLAQATGELVCILESDDYYYPTKIEENVNYLRRYQDVGLVHSDADILFPSHL